MTFNFKCCFHMELWDVISRRKIFHSCVHKAYCMQHVSKAELLLRLEMHSEGGYTPHPIRLFFLILLGGNSARQNDVLADGVQTALVTRTLPRQ